MYVNYNGYMCNQDWISKVFGVFNFFVAKKEILLPLNN